MKLHHRRLALVAAGIAGTGVLVTGVANAATSSHGGDGLSGISARLVDCRRRQLRRRATAPGKLAQALKQIRTESEGRPGQRSRCTVDTEEGSAERSNSNGAT